MKNLLLLGAIGIMTFAAFNFGNPFLENLRRMMLNYADANTTEKIYVQMDKSLYKPGEDVWLSAFVRDGNTLKAAESEVVYVELLNPRGGNITTLTLAVNNGVAAADFKLDASAAGGQYKVKAYTAYMQARKEFYEKEFTVQAVVLPRLNMKLDFQQKGYGKGANAKAELSLETLENKPLANKDFNYVVSLEGAKLLNNSGKTDNNGKAVIDFNLPKDLETNDGLLNVTIEYQGQTESISRAVPITLGDVDLQFLPEGGNYVAGLPARIGFKALDEFGTPTDVAGNICESTDGKTAGKIVASFNSYHDGMGATEFTPQSKKHYVATLSSSNGAVQVYQLADPLERGYTLHSTHTPEGLKVDINTTENEQLHIAVLQSGDMQFGEAVNPVGGHATVFIPTSSMPIGLASLALFDAKNTVRAERLIFINQDKQLNISIKADKEKYLPREKATLTIQVTDTKGLPVAGQFALAVVDDKLLTFADDRQAHVLSSILLNSDLKGDINEPNFYFDKKDDPNRIKPYIDREVALDYMLMTQGWKNFKVEDVFKENIANQYKHKIEKLTFAGTVKDGTTGNMLAGAKVTFEPTGVSVTTDMQGRFEAKSIKINQPLTVRVSYPKRADHVHVFTDYQQNLTFALYEKGNIKGSVTDKNGRSIPYTTVYLYTEAGAYLTEINTDAEGKYKFENITYGTYKVYCYYGGYTPVWKNDIAIKTTDPTIVNIKLEEQQIQLEEVTVTSTKDRRVKNVPMMAAPASRAEAKGNGGGKKKATNKNKAKVKEVEVVEVAVADEMDAPVAMMDMGGAVEEAPPMPEPMMPEVAADAPVEKQQVGAEKIVEDLGGFQNEDMKNLVAAKSIHIDDVKDAGLKKPMVPAQPAFFVRYYTAREFYTPKYKKGEIPKVRTDFRSTIFWSPSVTTDRNGIAKIEFPCADDITQYRVTVEGFGNEGGIGRAEFKFFTQTPLAISTKVPTAALTGDKINIPVTVVNNTDYNMAGVLSYKISNHLQAAAGAVGTNLMSKPKTDIALAAREAKTFVLPLEAMRMTDSAEVVITCNTGNYNDKVETLLEIDPRGFPVDLSFGSDGQNADQTFDIDVNDLVNGSLQATLNIHPNTLSEIVDGLESMVRMPGGCFEQTTFSNYPNIMVLQYLRETGTLNKTLKDNANTYLTEGYKRLTGYESHGGGFEWFGNSPAHEALSAMGVTQFEEMKSVFNGVDNEMIKRTVKWLLTRRDGKGGWTLNPHALHSWTTGDLAETYIVYSLCEAGYGKEIAPEIEKSYNDALKSEDPYTMSLMANAFFKLGDKRATELLDKVVAKQGKDGIIKAKSTTVVCSQGVNADIETTALASLAILQQKGRYRKELQDALSFLKKQKSYYGYGTTEGTVYTLRAILGYTKESKKAPEDGEIAVLVNGKNVKTVNYVAGQNEIPATDIAQYLVSGKNKVEVKFKSGKKDFSPLPYDIKVNYATRQPASNKECAVSLKTEFATASAKQGSTVRLNATIQNTSNQSQGMTTVMLGIPGGLTPQIWQLKELKEKGVCDFYELFDGYVVLHITRMEKGETRKAYLDLRADVPGTYEAPASQAFLYYTHQYRMWDKPGEIRIEM